MSRSLEYELPKYIDPEHATRDNTISYMGFMQTAKILQLNFDAFYDDYKKRQIKE